MSARVQVLLLLAVGLVLLAVGAVIFFAAFPHTPDDFGWFAYAADDAPDADGYADWDMGWPGVEGDLRISLVGAAIAGVGFLVVLVPIIAWGVRLGRALERSQEA